jgi:hypothetical protein
MRWNEWRRYFEANAQRPLPRVEQAPELEPAQHSALVRSLQKFQLGETGEGRLANQVDTVRLRGVDDDFRACVKMFVREEGRHARVLGFMLRALGAGLVTRDWSAAGFRTLRRMIGVRVKLFVALAAEAVGAGFYGLMSERLPDGEVPRALRELCSDEAAHLRFQSEFFHSQLPNPIGRALFCLAWAIAGRAAAMIVLVDHRATFRAFGVPLTLAWARMTSHVDHGAREIWHPFTLSLSKGPQVRESHPELRA